MAVGLVYAVNATALARFNGYSGQPLFNVSIFVCADFLGIWGSMLVDTQLGDGQDTSLTLGQCRDL
jgi:hypothetical protein